MTPTTITQYEEPRPAPTQGYALPECNCPDDCDRDHENE